MISIQIIKFLASSSRAHDMGPLTNRWSEAGCWSFLTQVASLDGTIVKLLSIMFGACGMLGRDLRRFVITAAVVDVVVTVVIGSVTFAFFSSDNIW